MKVYINIYKLFEIIHLNERKFQYVLNVSILLRRHDILAHSLTGDNSLRNNQNIIYCTCIKDLMPTEVFQSLFVHCIIGVYFTCKDNIAEFVIFNFMVAF